MSYWFSSGHNGVIVVWTYGWGSSMKYYSTDEKVLEEFFAKSTELDDEEWHEWVYELTRDEREIMMHDYFRDKRELNNMDSTQVNCHTHSFTGMGTVSLGNCTTVTPQNWISFFPAVNDNQEKEGNTPMCYRETETVNEATTVRDQRKYLLNDLYRLRDAKVTAAHKAFHMEPVGPTTISEMIEWIKADNFELKKEFAKYGVWEFAHFVKWMDKVNKPDEEGYTKAKDAIDKAYKDAERVIKIKTPEAGLDALTAFETATFH